MTESEMADDHKRRHVALHRHLDELVADYIGNTGNLPSKVTLMQFMKWSAEQTKHPSGHV